MMMAYRFTWTCGHSIRADWKAEGDEVSARKCISCTIYDAQVAAAEAAQDAQEATWAEEDPEWAENR